MHDADDRDSQDTNPVLVENADGITVVTLNEPERRNPLSNRIIARMTEVLHDLEDDASCRVVIIRGAGKGFCAGADLGRMRSATPLEDRAEYDKQLVLNRTLRNYSKPTISAVHGFALGAGCNLMNWCDISVVEEDARLGYPEIGGGVPIGASAPNLVRLVGRKFAFEFALTGALIPTQRALQTGLVNHVVATGEAFTTALELARQIARHSPFAVRLSKEVIQSVDEMSYELGIIHAKEVRVIGRLDPDFEKRMDEGESRAYRTRG